MPRTATTKKAAPQKEETTIEVVDYSKMPATALKKLLDERKIEGRSKLTKKEAMVKVLELFDQNPEDKAAIAALVAEISTPRKKAASKSELEETVVSATDEETKEEVKDKKSRTKKEKVVSEETVLSKKTRAKKDKETTESEEEKPKKTRAKKDKATTESEEEKPKKSRAKKDKETTESEEEKPKKSRAKKDKATTESEEEKPKKTRSKKEKVVEVSEPVSVETLISDKSPSPSIIEMPEDNEATQIVDVPEPTQIDEPAKKQGRNLPGAVRVLPEIVVNEGKQEVRIPEEEMRCTPTAHQPEISEIEDDPAMFEILDLTRDILRKMKYLQVEAQSDGKFREYWTRELKELRDKYDNELGMRGVGIDE